MAFSSVGTAWPVRSFVRADRERPTRAQRTLGRPNNTRAKPCRDLLIVTVQQNYMYRQQYTHYIYYNKYPSAANLTQHPT
eukprot:6627039-Heterocapsa_arctica.AAC.1